ncbi:MAG TPA: methyltransferase domain-containing protein [Chloroflexota bacterium]|nr:methyltransferase domain-containing protein [Chloroflexota bacterium]
MPDMTVDQARQFLEGFDHCAHPLSMRYLNMALDRIIVTMGLVPRLQGNVRVLELGAMPYLMTALMMRRFPNYSMELANEPDRLKEDGGRARLIHRGEGIDLTLEYKGFNLETDRFPYEDGSFDIVLYCEIIEHMMYDPTHSLYEIHRVLKPGGHMLITTPNAFRYAHYVQLLTGENIYPPYSGYGPYARHHREFSPKELRLLLKECNFEMEELITAYDPAYHDGKSRLDGLARWLYGLGFLREKMDVIHLRARAVGKPVFRYPPELYLDVHAYHPAVDDSLEMGAKEDGRLESGFHAVESWPPTVRWTDRHARIRMESHGQAVLGIHFYSGPKELARQVEGNISLNGVAHRFSVAAGEWAELRFPIPAGTTGPLLVEIDLDQTWVPRDLKLDSDSRQLGVALQRLWLE